jgi:hypothetical protein
LISEYHPGLTERTGGTVSATTRRAGGAAALPPRQAPPVEQAREVASHVNSGAGQGSSTVTCKQDIDVKSWDDGPVCEKGGERYNVGRFHIDIAGCLGRCNCAILRRHWWRALYALILIQSQDNGNALRNRMLYWSEEPSVGVS